MINEKSIGFDFPEGILGFENIKKFIIKDSKYKPFSIMQSINKDVSFLVTSPFNFLSEYLPNIQEKIGQTLKQKKRMKELSYV